jgi:hypothetical protein
MFLYLPVARERARRVVGDAVWDKLSPEAQTSAIADEVRLIEAEHAAPAPNPKSQAEARELPRGASRR